MDRDALVAEMQRRLKELVVEGMRNTAYLETAVSVMFTVAAEALTQPHVHRVSGTIRANGALDIWSSTNVRRDDEIPERGSESADQ